MSKTRITFVGHASTLIESKGVRILTDPLLRRRISFLWRYRKKVSDEWMKDIDAVLISHNHNDHLDIPSLKKIEGKFQLLVPAGVSKYLELNGIKDFSVVKEGDELKIGRARVLATPARHHGGRKPFGQKSAYLGYVVKGDHNVYFAGDTDIFSGMEDIGRIGLDCALIPVWGWGPKLGPGHLNPSSAADALKLLKPKVAIPIHWGTLMPIFMAFFSPMYMIRPPKDFKENAKAANPDVDVRVINPGMSTKLD